MGVLFFVCPATGLEVSTEVDVDPFTYADIARSSEPVSCPHCAKTHNLSELDTWTVEPRPDPA
jgi:hypothetical protein